MNIIYLLIGIIIFLVLFICFIISKFLAEKEQLTYIVSVLDDIEQGNLNRRVLAFNNDMTSNICYKINAIVENCKIQLVQKADIEQANRQIMTSLSHDVKTPLTSLIGYMDAIKNGVVIGAEKDSYTETAWRKAYDLKEYIDMLFDWFKLNSNEWQFNFEIADINELTRNIIIDWIPEFEKSGFAYEITVDEKELHLPLDINAYTRIINNLVQNAVLHSNGSIIGITVIKQNDIISITVADNGIGIPQDGIIFVFDRLYKQDAARSAKGSGLGLSIVQELTKAHKGTIGVESVPFERTAFTVCFPIPLK